MNKTKTIYTIPEVMETLNLGRTSVYKAIGEGKLICKKYGRRSLVTEAALNEFIENLPNFKDK